MSRRPQSVIEFAEPICEILNVCTSLGTVFKEFNEATGKAVNSQKGTGQSTCHRGEGIRVATKENHGTNGFLKGVNAKLAIAVGTEFNASI